MVHIKINFKRKLKNGCITLASMGGSDGKEPICNAGDLGSIPVLGRSPGGGHGNPLWYENPTDRGARQATDHRVAKRQTRLKPLGMWAFRNGLRMGMWFRVG